MLGQCVTGEGKVITRAGASTAQRHSCRQEATLCLTPKQLVYGMATQKCGLWLGVVALGIFLPEVVVKLGVGKKFDM